MSAILIKIMDDQATARKNRDQDKLTVLTTLIGEIQRRVTPVITSSGLKLYNDDQVVSTIRALVKSWSTTYNNQPISEKAQFEIDTISRYLPVTLSQDELQSIFGEISPANIGEWMKFLKINYSGRYDPKMASGMFN